MNFAMPSTRVGVPVAPVFKVSRQHVSLMRASPRRGPASQRALVITRAEETSEAKGFGKKSVAKVERKKKVSPKEASEARLEQSRMQAQYAEDERIAKAQGVPEVVSNRMLYRIIGFAGVPMMIGFASFPLFYYLKKFADPPVDVPVWFAYIASALTFGGAAIGITYGVMSASWDPRIRGTALGLDEFKENSAGFRQNVMNGVKTYFK